MSVRPGCAGDDQQTGRAGLNLLLKMKKPSGIYAERPSFSVLAYSRLPETNCGSGTKSQLANKLSIASS